MKPEISIIVPMYNSKLFLDRSLKSCTNQDFNGDVQVVLVNDGSTDNTLNIAERFIKKNKSTNRKFDLYSQDNQGASATRNFGVSIAESDNIFFLDSDDYIEREAITEATKVLNSRNDIGLVYSDHRKVKPSGEPTMDRIKNDFSLPELLTGMYLGHFRAMPKHVFDEVGGFDKNLTHSEDYDLILKVATQGHKIIHVPKILYNYVSNDQSLALGNGGFERIVKGGQKSHKKRLQETRPRRRSRIWKTMENRRYCNKIPN